MEHGLIAGKTRIGWIGTGIMGTSMCSHVCKITVGTDNATGQAIKSSTQYYPTYVYNRTMSKVQPLIDNIGQTIIHPCPSVDQVASQSDIIFTMLGLPSDVREVYYGNPQTGSRGLIASAAPGTVLVDMTTSEPTLAKQIAADAAKRNIHTIDAPVSGGDIGAKEGKLSIMLGGQQQVMYAIFPLFQSMGKNITYCGPAGFGQHTKMVNQIVIANNMIGICEGILYG